MADGTQLAQFLRSRRERLVPEEVGFPSTGRRRTPGLRREELATLAGVSIDYLIRLEQGRDTKPSAAVLAALAEALRLSDEEKQYLGRMAVTSTQAELCPAPRPLVGAVRPTLRALLDRLAPTPAFVLGPLNDIVGWNEPWERLGTSLGMLQDERPNVARYVFLSPVARQVLPDWVLVADVAAGMLRSAQPHWGSDPSFDSLLEELRAVPEFVQRWDSQAVADLRPGFERLNHPSAGALHMASEILGVQDADQRVVVWLPADEATQAAMRTIFATPLHVVRPA